MIKALIVVSQVGRQAQAEPKICEPRYIRNVHVTSKSKGRRIYIYIYISFATLRRSHGGYSSGGSFHLECDRDKCRCALWLRGQASGTEGSHCRSGGVVRAGWLATASPRGTAGGGETLFGVVSRESCYTHRLHSSSFLGVPYLHPK